MVPPGTVIRDESDLDPIDCAPSGYFVLLAEIGKSRKIWVKSYHVPKDCVSEPWHW